MFFDSRFAIKGGEFVLLIISVIFTGHVSAVQLKKGTCRDGYVMCRNGDCISSFDVCDGTENCSDGSDEIHAVCFENSCLHGTFRCAYGGCIEESGKCNGLKDCVDNSDELLPTCPGFQWFDKPYPPCSGGEFQCRNGECTKGSRYDVRCDGIPHCSDRSDESIPTCYNYRDVSCPKGSFKCAYGACISSSDICNGRDDCADGSDEHYILCNRPRNETKPTTRPNCSKGSFKCTDGACISLRNVCNDRNDCTDGSDEHYTLCNRSFVKNETIIPRPNPSDGKCVVPEHTSTFYSDLNCNEQTCALKPNDVINHLTVAQVHCRDTFVHATGHLFVRCINGTLSPKNHLCVRLCQPLVSTSLDIECSYLGEMVSCTNGVKANTQAKIKCKDGYGERAPLHTTDVCLPNGEWLYDHQSCSYKCGIKESYSGLKPLADYGKDTVATNHSWNVGLYFYNHVEKTYEIFCGGTLISPFTVLTAAHCIVNENTTERISEEYLWVTLGKTYRNWSVEEDGVQKIQVKNVFIPENYAARNLSWLNDVAILELKEQAIISMVPGSPMPACLTSSRNGLQPKAKAKIAGWGLTHHNNFSNVLQEAELTYEPYESCREFANNSFLEDHFCAFERGVTHLPNINSGDSGTGFIRKSGEYYCVYGVASIRLKTKYDFTLSSFTDVTHNDIREFIRKHLDDICERHNNFPFTIIP